MKNKHYERYKYDEMISQDNNNPNEKNYSLKTHTEQNNSLTYEYYKDTKGKQKNPKVR